MLTDKTKMEAFEVELTTAKNYLLLTERIAKKPMLRTRFTSQSYFVLAALLDLADQDILTIDDNLDVKDGEKFARLPSYLSVFKSELSDEINQNRELKDRLSVITSWDIANQLYDGLGSELLAADLVTKVPFKNNLDTHVIYLPKAEARNQVREELRDQINNSKINRNAISLIVILEQLDALKWVFTDQDESSELTSAFHQQVDGDAFYAKEKALAKLAQDIITRKKFWFDSWLS
ncbi:hypothetical protein FC51_GL001150 [Lentilactobacillus parabuchneri DSM 5707 = NBRC 107865]|jgi:hypothetical protein|uniref:Uncharacterized protein n=2 Tax=Lentilactobacillus parabuchneri TaxID=152331 RepID=A0A0R1Z649_9LACO|nr:hypothetical protein FC51_GL001150 [Lentilactobacillus parabuchneri DSM 5707 = NBRC 107865]KRN79866.1 hypothetical protein IV42_GL000764 [Lentilactobacillus parabuchneri]